MTKTKKTKEDPKDAKILELINMLQRLQAEFENYKKRSDKQCEDFKKFAVTELVKDLLPSLDSFEMAMKNDQDPEKFKQGTELVFAQLITTLEKQGLKKMEVNGKFNPYKQEVLLTEKHEDKKDEEILEELQPGYVFHEQVIRTAKVKINKL